MSQPRDRSFRGFCSSHQILQAGRGCSNRQGRARLSLALASRSTSGSVPGTWAAAPRVHCSAVPEGCDLFEKSSQVVCFCLFCFYFHSSEAGDFSGIFFLFRFFFFVISFQADSFLTPFLPCKEPALCSSVSPRGQSHHAHLVFPLGPAEALSKETFIGEASPGWLLSACGRSSSCLRCRQPRPAPHLGRSTGHTAAAAHLHLLPCSMTHPTPVGLFEEPRVPCPESRSVPSQALRGLRAGQGARCPVGLELRCQVRPGHC